MKTKLSTRKELLEYADAEISKIREKIRSESSLLKEIDQSFMETATYLIIGILFGYSIIPIESRKSFVRSLLAGTIFNDNNSNTIDINNDDEIETDDTVDGYRIEDVDKIINDIVNDLSSNQELKNIINSIEILSDKKYKLKQYFLNELLPKISKTVSVSNYGEIKSKLMKKISNSDVKKIYDDFIKYESDIKEINKSIRKMVNQDTYGIIRKILKNKKYIDFENLLIRNNKDTSPGEIDKIKRKYLRYLLKNTKAFIKNKLSSVAKSVSDVKKLEKISQVSEDDPSDWLVNILSLNVITPE